MCGPFCAQDFAGYEQISRSVRIGGHSTSIRLEAAFWALLDDIARQHRITTPKLLSQLHDEALQRHGEVTNFASLLRTSCVLRLQRARSDSPATLPAFARLRSAEEKRPSA